MPTDIRYEIVLPAIARANREMPGFNLTPERLSQTENPVVLYGKSGALLDSLNLVSFVFLLEDEVLAKTGTTIKISTEDVLQTAKPPFASVDNLCDFIREKLSQAH